MNTLEATKRLIAAKAKAGQLPDAPTGPVIEGFRPKALAAALECEVDKSRVTGWTRISIHMSIPDAIHLAKFLRKN